MTPKLTNGGENLLLRAMEGDTITFSKIALGNGDCPANYKNLTALVNQQTLLGLDTYSLEEGGYIKLKAVLQNSELDAAFIWTEVGIYAEDPDGGSDILYAYGHWQLEGNDEQNAPALVPKASSSIVEMEIEYDIFVGEAENVTAALAESAVYTTQEQFSAHTTAQNNPHAVTKAQVGLGNVPNVATNDQTPTWTISGTLLNLASGETLAAAFGKLAKGVSSLISHIADTTAHITDAERTAWNGKAAGSHNHSAANITSGTLSTARGGTGTAGTVVTTQTWKLRYGDTGSGSVIGSTTAYIWTFGKVRRVGCSFMLSSSRPVQKLTLHTGSIGITNMMCMTAILTSGGDCYTIACFKNTNDSYFTLSLPSAVQDVFEVSLEQVFVLE